MREATKLTKKNEEQNTCSFFLYPPFLSSFPAFLSFMLPPSLFLFVSQYRGHTAPLVYAGN
jgi:hypothetical protein